MALPNSLQINKIPKLEPAKKWTNQDRCDVCLMTELHPNRCGGLVQKNCKSAGPFKCHYLCLLSYLTIPVRKGKFKGVKGFFVKEVIEQLSHIRDQKCAYCCRYSAPIQCCAAGCNRYFHYICGYRNSCLTQLDEYCVSFCSQHLPAEYLKAPRRKYEDCELCRETLPRPTDATYNPVAIVRTCGGSRCEPGWMHRDCVQQIAYSYGRNLVCPKCRSRYFRAYVAQRGIFVPGRKIRVSDWFGPAGANRSETVGCSFCGAQVMMSRYLSLSDLGQTLCKNCTGEAMINCL